MKRVVIGYTIALLLLPNIDIAVPANANFSGKWSLDKSKSQELPPQLENVESYTLTVTQDDQQLTVDTQITGGARPEGGGRRPDGAGGQGGGGFGGRRRPDSAGGDTQGQGQGQGGGRGRGGRGGFGMGSGTVIYKLDGSETKTEAPANGRGGAASMKAQWKDGGKSLELTTTRSFNFQGNETTRTTKDRWELADGGKTLKIKRSIDTQQGSQSSTLVFNKQ